jgi:DNA helicase-2/ATP-dependent DNA helicase PcrA
MAVNDHFRRRAGHSAVISVAGSGKTTTALNAIECLPSGVQTLLGAFNVSIRDEFKAKGLQRGLQNVSYANFNGFGWGICMRSVKGRAPELDKEKTSNVFEFQVYKPNYDDKEDMYRFSTWRPAVESLVRLFKSLNIHSRADCEKLMPAIVEHYDLDVPDEDSFDQAVLDTYDASIAHQAHYDFDDQKFMPIHFDWIVPRYDQVVVDEFQDVCPVEYELMSRAARGGQLCAIGDPDQTIYGFKGASPKTFPKFIQDYGAAELPLSICYRCSVKVVEEAQKIVPRIESAPGAQGGAVGHPKDEEFRRLVANGDFVLCRTTDELVATCIELMREGRLARVRGREFGTSLEFLIRRVSKGDDFMSIESFSTALLDYEMERSEQLTRLRREREIINLTDRCRSIRALSDQASDVDGVKKRLAQVFCGDKEKHGGIDLMTIHKSKGLQAGRVWILRPDLLPHPRSSEREWMLAEERRLKYVAITRAERELHWVQPPERR